MEGKIDVNFIDTFFSFSRDSVYISSHIFSPLYKKNPYKRPFTGKFKKINLFKLYEVLFILKNRLYKNPGFVQRYLDLYSLELAQALIENDREKVLEILGTEEAMERLFSRYEAMYSIMHIEGKKKIGMTYKNSDKYVAKMLLVDLEEGMRTQLNLTSLSTGVLMDIVLSISEKPDILIKEKTNRQDAKFVILKNENSNITIHFSNGKSRNMKLLERLILLHSLKTFFNRVIYKNEFDIKPFKLKNGLNVRNTECGTQMIGFSPEWIAPLTPVSVKLYGILKDSACNFSGD